MSYRGTFIFILSLGATMTSRADSVLEFQTTEFGGGEPIVGTVQISTSGSDTRLEIISVSSAEAGGMIFHGDQQEMIILDHAQANYMVINKQQLSAMSSQLGDAMTQMQQALAAMPPDKRAMAEQMMRQRIPAQAPKRAPATINDLASHGEVAGIACRNYEVIRSGRKVRELCVSDWDDIHGGQDTASAMKGIADFFDSMRQAFSVAGGMEVIDRQEELFEHMKELDGYPVLYRDFSPNGSLQRQTLLTGAREASVAPDFFEPPKDYKLQGLPQGMN